MPKRKRESPADAGVEDVIEKNALPKGAKQQRVEHKLAQGSVKVGHAFKIAKGFERQKLGRRQKTAAAQHDSAATERINAEIAALKVRSYCLRSAGWSGNAVD
jgi:ABC-type phosphate transport system auxiliary subunit